MSGTSEPASATALADFHACRYLTALERRHAAHDLAKPHFDDPFVELLNLRGREHEQHELARLRARGGEVAEFPGQPPADWAAAAADTLAAMQRGAHLIYQGVLLGPDWRGRPDFLVRVAQPSRLGDWSYEVLDAKLSRIAKARAIVQLSAYSALLEDAQGVRPEFMSLVLGDGREDRHRTADYEAYFRRLARLYAAAPEPAGPEPTDHCPVCDWRSHCKTWWRDHDHLKLVANMPRALRQGLAPQGVTTVAAFAALSAPLPRLDRGSPHSLLRAHRQAALQIRGRAAAATLHQLILPIESDRGLAALPAPSDGDLFFDIEGAPYATDHGLEYLFGLSDATGHYQAWWAADAASEKAAFEALIDAVTARLARWPDLHVYHYAPYEATAAKRLMGHHATREDAVDRLLRAGVLVDLYRVVRQGVLASVESYSIKQLEPLYDFQRAIPLEHAGRARQVVELSLMMGVAATPAVRDAVEAYNRDDCLSAWRLREWLEARRHEAEAQTGAPVPRPTPREAATPELQADLDRTQALAARLSAGVPADLAARTDAEQAHWLLAQLLGWHRREDKSSWFEYFRLCELSDDELLEERAALAGLTYQGVALQVKRSDIHRYRFAAQEHDIRKSEDSPPHDPRTQESAGTVFDINHVDGLIDLKRVKKSAVPHPTALIPYEIVKTTDQRASLFRLAEWVADHGIDAEGPFRAARDLLLRRPPRVGQAPGAPLTAEPDMVLAGSQLALALDHSSLPVQGPPGSGKTFTGARMILALVRAGRRVGITANSHKVFSHLLAEVCAAADQAGQPLTALQVAHEDQCPHPRVTHVETTAALAASAPADVIAGTSWLWARADMQARVDVLVIDEAGQMSLANVVACAPAAGSLVLLGDPRQLDQPRKGTHPPGAEASALDHMLAGAATVPPDRGLFLPETWRLHPEICAFTSQAFYQGRLSSREGLERQTLVARIGGPVGRLIGHGLRYVPVPHTGCQNRSPEEVRVITDLIRELLAGTDYVDREGARRSLRGEDILVMAPYNAQVALLAAALPPGVRAGTVDKFQGQEAPVAIYSMTTSSADEAPRGLDFLYSPNRLNVATSRAKALAVLVASPTVFEATCKTPKQIALVNAFCRFLNACSPWAQTAGALVHDH